MVGPLAYIGGKNRLAAKIISLLPEHTTYVEPFAGGAQVFFHKRPSEVEVLNDLDGEIVNLLRVCQWHHEELIRYLKYTVASRSWFDLLAKTDPATLTDVQRAGRFFYLQKNCFGGLVVKQHYHYAVCSPPISTRRACRKSSPKRTSASSACRSSSYPTSRSWNGTTAPQPASIWTRRTGGGSFTATISAMRTLPSLNRACTKSAAGFCFPWMIIPKCESCLEAGGLGQSRSSTRQTAAPSCGMARCSSAITNCRTNKEKQR